MVAVPLLIIATTLGYSLVDPNGKRLVSSSIASTPSSVSSNHRNEQWTFFYGVVLGMGLSSMISFEIKRRRLWERFRVTLFSWAEESSALVLGKYRQPTSIHNIKGTDMVSSSSENSITCGIRREVVSPEWCFTSTMSVSILTLYAGSQMVPHPSPGVEFYYVIEGEGFYATGEKEEAMKLSIGSCVVVDPSCFRGFRANTQTDLVLLRASDATVAHGQDVTLRDETSRSRTLAILNAGLHKVEALVCKYCAVQPTEESMDNMSSV